MLLKRQPTKVLLQLIKSSLQLKQSSNVDAALMRNDVGCLLNNYLM